MARSQLGINCPPELLLKLRLAAKERHVTVTALVLHWISTGLDNPDFNGKENLSCMESRLRFIETRLDELSRQLSTWSPAPECRSPLCQQRSAPASDPPCR